MPAIPGLELGNDEDTRNKGEGGRSGGGGGGGYSPPGGGGGQTLADLFGGGQWTSAVGFDPLGQGIFKSRRPAKAFFPQRNPTQFQGGFGGGTPQTVGGGMQRTASPMGASQVGPEGQPMGQAGLSPYLMDNFQRNAAGENQDVGLALLGQLGLSGGFDPTGQSNPLFGFLRQQRLQDAGALQRQAQLRRQLEDPTGQLQGMGLLEQLGIGSQVNRGLGADRLALAQGAQNRMFQLGNQSLGAHLGVKTQDALGRIDERTQNGINMQQRGGFWDALGGLGGSVLGSLVGG